MCKIPQLRTIKKSHEWLVEQDPETGITEFMLRQLVESGEIPCVKQGKKSLIDIDTLPEHIADWFERQSNQPAKKSAICKNESRTSNRNYGSVRVI